MVAEIVTVNDEKYIPHELVNNKIEHYKEIFQEKWENVYGAGHPFSEGDEMLVLREAGRVVGGSIIRRNVYSVTFRDFAILPEFRGKGHSKMLMGELEDVTENHHYQLMENGQKPQDIRMMYLRSLVYLDSNDREEARLPHLQFANYLRKVGFLPYIHNQHELSGVEKVAIPLYQRLYPKVADRLRVFKKKIIDVGVELKKESKEELAVLDERQWKIVMGGLDWKLGNYGKNGTVSYRYDLCPICKDMGSSEQNSENCKRCYIYNTCMEPFREIGRFKEDFEVSHAYFSEMREFMLSRR